jgi:signal transduction histidine kinase/FixJ family two-component response regulator
MNDMNKKPYTNQLFIFIILFLLSLIAVVIITQVNSDKNLVKLESGYDEAISTFQIGNRMNTLVNDVTSMDYRIRKLVQSADSNAATGLYDSIRSLKSEMNNLRNLAGGNKKKQQFDLISDLVSQKIEYDNLLLSAYYAKRDSVLQNVFNANTGKQLNDSIYATGMRLQIELEQNLQATLSQNSTFTDKTRYYGKMLSLVALASIVVLGSFIILRVLKQVMLIKELETAEKSAVKSAQIKEQFLANMSHEIRTPINAVIGFTGLLNKTQLEAEQKKYVGHIQQSSSNLLTIINDILDISKIQANKLRIVDKPFDLQETCRGLASILQFKMEEKKLQFALNIDPSVPTRLIGDGDRLNQILTNLLNNATKFTQQGSIELSIKTVKRLYTNVEIQFIVKDTGIGIPANKLDKIFERFEQVDTDMTRAYGGTGLGLSIVKSLVTQMNGQIEVKSEMGKGSSFIVTLPYKEIETARPESSIVTESQTKSSKQAFGRFRLLVAEDNQMNQMLLHHILDQWHVDYEMMDDGEKVIEQLKKEDYDLVLMDIQMPIMDGYTTARVIRDELKSNIPIIAMTAHVLIGEKEKCLNAGMDDYLPKPIDEQFLFEILKKYLNIHSAAPVKKQVDTIQELQFIDLAQLNKNFGGNVDFILKMVRQFEKQFPKELSDLRMAIESSNFSETRRVAHLMKSTVTILSKSTPMLPQLNTIEKTVVNDERDWSEIENAMKTLDELDIQLNKELQIVQADLVQ